MHADHVESVAVQLLLRPPERFRLDQITVARRIGALVHERHHLDDDFAIGFEDTAEQPACLSRIVGLAVPADRRLVAWIEHERHGAPLSPGPVSRRCSLRYRVPESGAMTTTRADEGGRGRSTAVRVRSAATMAAPVDQPPNKPASLARRRTASSASSGFPNSVRSGNPGS